MNFRIISFLFILFYAAGISAQTIELPDRLPKDLQNTATISALKKWIQIPTSEPNNLWIEEVTIFNEPWLNVYFEMDVTIDSKDVKDVDKVAQKIRSMLYAFKQAGSEINVLFNTYAVIRLSNLSYKQAVQIGQKKFVLPDDFKKVEVRILQPFDSYWKDKKMLSANGSGRSHALIELSKAFVSLSSLNSLTHELNHLLLRHQDAYYKDGKTISSKEAKALSSLNSKHCQLGSIHPLEIYLGLLRWEVLAPGWENYVNRSYIIGHVQNHQLSIFHRASSSVIGSRFEIKIYHLSGEKVVHQKWIQGNHVATMDFQRVNQIPDHVDVSHLKPGVYIAQVSLQEIVKNPNIKTLNQELNLTYNRNVTTKILVGEFEGNTAEP